MRKIDISYPKAVYSLKQVEQAAKDYQAICNIDVNEHDDSIVCSGMAENFV